MKSSEIKELIKLKADSTIQILLEFSDEDMFSASWVKLQKAFNCDELPLKQSFFTRLAKLNRLNRDASLDTLVYQAFVYAYEEEITRSILKSI